MAKTKVPAVEGLFGEENGSAFLIGGKVPGRESYFFPKNLAGGDPSVPMSELEEVKLSNRGTVWSYTTSHFAPPPPFIVNTEPYEPITVAAVHLEREQMVVLGQCMNGTTADDLTVGAEVELVIDTLYEDDDYEYTVWKWQLIPVGGE